MNEPAVTTDTESPREAMHRLLKASPNTAHLDVVFDYLQEQWERARMVSSGVAAVALAAPLFGAGGTPAFAGTTTFAGMQGGTEVKATPAPQMLLGVMRRFLLVVTPEPPEQEHFVARGCLIDDIACMHWEEPYEDRGDWTRIERLAEYAGDVGARVEWLDP